MRFRTRLILDRLFAVPLSLACNVIVRALGCIANRDHSITPEGTERIVICKLVGMGSILQATPLLRALKIQFPSAKVTFLTTIGNRALLERLEHVDEILFIDDRSAFSLAKTTLEVLVRLTKSRIDHYFDLELYSGFACLLSVFSLARNRFGFCRYSARFKKGIYTHLIYFNTRMPVRGLYLQLGRLAGTDANSSERLGTIRVDPDEMRALTSKLTELGLPPKSPYIVVNPNASDLLIERRWPEDHVVAAITLLADHAHYLVLLGSHSEATYVRRIWERIPGALRSHVINAAGQLELGEAFALLSGAACVLTNDTGPMHMAFALNRPTVCLFGPGDPSHYAVQGANIVMLCAPVSCSPCLYEINEPPCRGDNVCMQRILPDSVVYHVEALLKQPEAVAGWKREPLVWNGPDGQVLGTVANATNAAR